MTAAFSVMASPKQVAENICANHPSMPDHASIESPTAFLNSSNSLVFVSMDKTEETYSEEETECRREAALRQMLVTPHKPQEPIGKKRKKSSQSK